VVAHGTDLLRTRAGTEACHRVRARYWIGDMNHGTPWVSLTWSLGMVVEIGKAEFNRYSRQFNPNHCGRDRPWPTPKAQTVRNRSGRRTAVWGGKSPSGLTLESGRQAHRRGSDRWSRFQTLRFRTEGRRRVWSPAPPFFCSGADLCRV